MTPLTLPALLDGMIDAVIVTDGAFVIRLWNAAAEQIYGWTAEEAIGRSVGELLQQRWVSPEQRLAALEGFGASGRWTGEVLQVRRDGTDVRILSAVTRLDGEDTVLAVNRDVSAWREAELALEAARARLAETQKMDALGRLAAGIAHDFNNLLVGISGFAELAAYGLPPDHPSRLPLQRIVETSARGSRLTGQLLAFGRKQPARVEVVDVGALLVGMGDLLRVVVGPTVTVSFDVPPAPLSLDLDRSLLEQVVMNLAVNAREAMPSGGGLRIEARAVAGAVEVVVSDTGVGMDASTRARVFEPFFTTKGSARGVGLGLSVVDGVVRQTGGTIEVWSEPGQGTRFTIRLPRGEAAGAATVEARPPVLVVEDQAEVREVLALMVERLGYRPVLAEDGRHALDLWVGAPVRLPVVLSDIMMPRLDGLELARELRARDPGVQVVFCSGYSARQAGDVAAEVLLKKPVRLASLGDALAAAWKRAGGPSAAAPREQKQR